MIKLTKNEIAKYPFRKAMKKPIPIDVYQMPDEFEVETLEGTMKGKKGDFLMIGVNGEMYPCDRGIFKQTYEFVDVDKSLENDWK